MKYVCALITVKDIRRSRFLYETILGQTVATDFGENIGFEGGFALHKRDHFEGLLGGKKTTEGSNAFELYFEEDDLDRLEELVRKEGLEFVHETREQPWRQKVLRFYDYDRNIVEVGERLEHEAYRLHQERVPIEEIMKLTSLGKGQIETAIQEYSH